MYNEFLALVYAPPVYFNKMTIAELRNEAHKIDIVINTITLSEDEGQQLHEYFLTYAQRIKTLNKQYST